MKRFFSFRWFMASICSLFLLAPFIASATPSPIQLSVGVGGTTHVSGLPQYIVLWYRYLIGISTIVAVVVMIYGGFLYLWGSVGGSAKQGLEIVKNACLGLVLVFSSYVILQTINPAALTLQVNGLTNIGSVGLHAGTFSAANGSEQAFQPPEHISERCAVDSDCTGTSGAKCMRAGYVHYNATNGPTSACSIARGYVASLLTGGTAVIYYLYQSGLTLGSDGAVNSSVPQVDVTNDRTMKPGYCASGLVGQRCRCAGQGCMLTEASVNALDDVGLTSCRVPIIDTTELSRWGWVTGNGASTLLEFYKRPSPNGYDTNNHWTGVNICAGDLRCIFFRDPTSPIGGTGEGGNGEGWFCQNIQTMKVPDGFSPATGAHTCLQDSDCGSDGHCLRTDPDAHTPRGECSQGSPGQRCECANYGCATFPNVSQRFIGCTGGTHCSIQGEPEIGGPQIGMNGNWFCAQPPAAPSAAAAAAAGSGKSCRYSCAGASTVVGSSCNDMSECSGTCAAGCTSPCAVTCESAGTVGSCNYACTGSDSTPITGAPHAACHSDGDCTMSCSSACTGGCTGTCSGLSHG